ncbi:MAG: Uma2 family endonuclease [Ktedonobacteraceae bacterium]|nr:Uma2 family endonuclease [Ktedonobacteraceae bacterium]
MPERLQHDEIAYYYDMHPTEEDLMGETAVHAALIRYLMEVLVWLFDQQLCAVHDNLNFYQTPFWKEHPIAPDIAVIKGVDFEWVRSWRIGKTGPAPQVVLEIASDETWHKDLTEKPSKYAVMGVQEYFAYDPNQPALLREGRLFGWRLDRASRSMRELSLDRDGRLWSQHLESFLVPDSSYLCLYDRAGHRRLTRAEAEAEARRAETRRAEAEKRRAEVEKRRADAADRRVEAEKRRADTADQRAKALAEKLRSLGIDPDQI